MPDNPRITYQVASRYLVDGGVLATEVWTDQLYQYYLAEKLLYTWPNPYGFIPFIIWPNLREPKQLWGSAMKCN